MAGKNSTHSRMSDYETMMWTIEQDPWLASTMSSMSILDREPDFEDVRLRFRHAVAETPILRQHVEEGLPGTPPTYGFRP